jgi:hypothetical protein
MLPLKQKIQDELAIKTSTPSLGEEVIL